MREFEIKPELEGKLIKLAKRDKPLYNAAMKKIAEILGSIDIGHYKNLRYNMKASKRVHIGHFVLVFSYNKDFISFEDFDHHDNVYGK